ncbi:NAD(P)-binding protein [Paraburkholderia dipogonis]|uniref:NAD(P)-binding protein n=1 Tax=Paraburkholderia dipogonis TaxID=1211383 RepID=UPI0036219424
MSEERFDGIIIGAGHNGLITAAYMAKAGLKMAVFDPRINVGGLRDGRAVGAGLQTQYARDFYEDA